VEPRYIYAVIMTMDNSLIPVKPEFDLQVIKAGSTEHEGVSYERIWQTRHVDQLQIKVEKGTYKFFLTHPGSITTDFSYEFSIQSSQTYVLPIGDELLLSPPTPTTPGQALVSQAILIRPPPADQKVKFVLSQCIGESAVGFALDENKALTGLLTDVTGPITGGKNAIDWAVEYSDLS